MKLSELTSLLEIVITEEINKNQLISVANALQVQPEVLRAWIEKTDPTPRKSFAFWILRGLKSGDIRTEDDVRIKTAINRFIELRNAQRIEDIMQFPTLHDLETRLEQLVGQGAKRKGFAGVDPMTLPGVSVIEDRPDLTLYKVTDPDSLAKIGEGTKWCTRYSYSNSSNTAASYLKRFPYLVVGYKNGRPYVQFNPDYSQVMDVTDRMFHNTNPDEAKKLDLPPPEIVKKGVPTIIPQGKPFRHLKPPQTDPQSPSQRELQNWLNYTTTTPEPHWADYINYRKRHRLPPKGKDEDYERRVARAITRSTHPFNLMRVLGSFSNYALGEIKGQRVPEVEKAILEKDFKPTMVAGKGGRGSGSRAKIPGIEDIITYVIHNIQGHWPEFEKKIQDDPANSIRYYLSTGLTPDNIPDGLVKSLVLFSQFIKDRHPSVSNDEFEHSMRDFVANARKEFKHGKFSPVIHKVLIPYVKLTGKSIERILGLKLANQLRRDNYSVKVLPERA